MRPILAALAAFVLLGCAAAYASDCYGGFPQSRGYARFNQGYGYRGGYSQNYGYGGFSNSNYGYSPRISNYDCFNGSCHLRSYQGGGYSSGGYYVNRWYYDAYGQPYSVRVFVRY